MQEENLSKSRIDRAGTTLRRLGQSPASVDPGDVAEAFRILRVYRRRHSYPLTKTSVGLRQFLDTEERAARGRIRVSEPAQRLKRAPAIVAKLVRETTRLSQMEDIAGCRVVLHDLVRVPDLLGRISSNWELLDPPDDYVTRPKPDGYRAVHVRVVRDGHVVEIQLRTDLQHAWAELVDQLTLALQPRFDVKHGVAPPDLLTGLRELADVLAQVDGASAPSRDVSQLRSEVQEIMGRIATSARNVIQGQSHST
jgi:putative GTP pyrophosphokinase